MFKVILVFFGLFIAGCNANESYIDPLKPQFETISFDVVQKSLNIKSNLPNHLLDLLNQWFDNKVKVNGFDGNMILTISEYSEKISLIGDGKKVDIYLAFNIVLNKSSNTQTKIIKGDVSSYGTLTGNFSLQEFDIVIQNTQSDLLLRLSRDLKSKI